MRRFLVIALLLVGCSPGVDPSGSPASSTTTTTPPETTEAGESTTTTPMAFDVSSPSFANGGVIPQEHTCDGADVSPELEVVGIPSTAETLAVIVEDPDAPLGTWYHWVVFDIVPESSTLEIPRGTPPGGTPGVNSWHLPGYRGPCPPEGEEHSYVFKVFALDARLDLPEGVEAAQVYDAMEGMVVSSTELIGTYGR